MEHDAMVAMQQHMAKVNPVPDLPVPVMLNLVPGLDVPRDVFKASQPYFGLGTPRPPGVVPVALPKPSFQVPARCFPGSRPVNPQLEELHRFAANVRAGATTKSGLRISCFFQCECLP